MNRKTRIHLFLIVAALLMLAWAVENHFKPITNTEELASNTELNQKEELTRRNDDISFNQSMGKGLSIMYGPSGYVFKDDHTDGYYVEAEHIKDLGQVYISIAAFMNEPMQIEKLDLEYQIYKVEQDEESLVYSKVIPYPSNSLEPHTFYEYDLQVDYWDQNIFKSGQKYILRLKHSDTCDYYLAEADIQGKISLINNNIVRYDEFKVEIR